MVKRSLTLGAVVFVSALAACAHADEDPATRTAHYFKTYGETPLFRDNRFVGAKPEDKALPDAAAWRERVPRAIWDGHPEVTGAFADSWRMVGEKLHRPEQGTNFKRNYVYTTGVLTGWLICSVSGRIRSRRGLELRFCRHVLPLAPCRLPPGFGLSVRYFLVGPPLKQSDPRSFFVGK